MDIVSSKKSGLRGIIEIPADKSITHRAFMFSALAKGKSRIINYSKCLDCMSTLEIVRQLGCEVNFINERELVINSENALKKPDNTLNCGNSGTTARLMTGILAGQNFQSQISGDESLSKRPMKRVIAPLELMGGQFIHKNYTLPVTIKGAKLQGINYNSPLSSAQVKSCILLAGLNAEGATSFIEPYKSRNHTELMLENMGADIKVKGNAVTVAKSRLNPADITVCGDISSAAFFIVAALIVPESEIIIRNTGINETRSGIIDVLREMNGDIQLINERVVSNEKIADIKVRYSNLKAVNIQGALIPRLIDELPVIALAASQAEGTTVIKDAQDLRNKETDRISAAAAMLKKLGADMEETQDGFIINGKSVLKGGCETDCNCDHRIAMSAYTAGLICTNPVKIKDFDWVNISFPEFTNLMNKLF